MSEFLHMGGYGFYVWLSYGIALLVLLANVLSPVLLKKKLLRELARREQRAGRL
ncbi:MAG: heme exporter protein CcmD [Thiogranum sp.]